VKVQEMAIGDDTIRPHSLREGRPQRLVFPDYSGNFHFSTLGNLLQHPRAGLLFWDFGAQSLLLVTGEARIVWEGPEVGFRPFLYLTTPILLFNRRMPCVLVNSCLSRH
jgi:hypothetical protein